MKITASNEAEARKEALLIFQQEGKEVSQQDLLVKKVGSTGGFLGLAKKEIFQVSLQEQGDEKEENGTGEEEEYFPVHGLFSLRFTSQDVLLKVTPPLQGGKKVDWEDVLEALEKREIVELDKKNLLEIVEEARGEWEKIAPRKKELDRGAQVTFTLSKNKMEAYAHYLPPLGGEDLDMVKIGQLLKEAGIVHGLKREVLETLLGRKEKVENLVIATGDDPTPGQDAYLEYHYERAKKTSGIKREDGSIDFRSLDNIINVLPGDLLVTKVPSVPGKPGTTVTGEEVPPPKPKDVRLPRGKNVTASEDNLELTASIEGQLVETSGLINVFAVYTVNGDVDMEVGNIDFIGNVDIQGSVREGFVIKARGDVMVKGGVNAATIESGGDIIIGKGFQGRKKGVLRAKGNIQVMFVENARIMAQGDVLVERAVMHSHIQAGGNLIVRGKGLLVGGVVQTGKAIEAVTIGSSLATPTDLQVGIGPQTRDRVLQMEEEIEMNQANLSKTEQGMSFLLQKKKEEGSLPRDKEHLLQRMVETRRYLMAKKEELQKEYEALNKSLQDLSQGKVRVKGTIYSGVSLTIGYSQRRIRDSMSHTTFVFEDGEIISKSF